MALTEQQVPRFDDRVASHEFRGVALVLREGAPIFSYAAGIADRAKASG